MAHYELTKDQRERIERYFDSLKARTRAMTREQLEAVVARLKARQADKDA